MGEAARVRSSRIQHDPLKSLTHVTVNRKYFNILHFLKLLPLITITKASFYHQTTLFEAKSHEASNLSTTFKSFIVFQYLNISTVVRS